MPEIDFQMPSWPEFTKMTEIVYYIVDIFDIW